MALLFLWRNCGMCLPKILFPVLMLAFIFSLPPFFTWPLTFIIFSPPLWNFHVLLSTKFVCLALSLYVIHVSLNIRNNGEKDTTLLLFFFSLKVRAAMRFSSVAFGLPYLLIELFYIGVPVVTTDGRSVARAVYGHVITKFSRMDRFT